MCGAVPMLLIYTINYLLRFWEVRYSKKEAPIPFISVFLTDFTGILELQNCSYDTCNFSLEWNSMLYYLLFLKKETDNILSSQITKQENIK